MLFCYLTWFCTFQFSTIGLLCKAVQESNSSTTLSLCQYWVGELGKPLIKTPPIWANYLVLDFITHFLKMFQEDSLRATSQLKEMIRKLLTNSLISAWPNCGQSTTPQWQCAISPAHALQCVTSCIQVRTSLVVSCDCVWLMQITGLSMWSDAPSLLVKSTVMMLTAQ